MNEWTMNPDWPSISERRLLPGDLKKRTLFPIHGGYLIAPWQYGDRVKVIDSYNLPIHKSDQVGRKGHVIETYTQGCPQIAWDPDDKKYQDNTPFCKDEHLEFLGPIRRCPGCEQPTKEPDFADYLCKDCR